MSVNINGKEAITEYQVVKNYKKNSKVKLKLHTGRTHQIRVHMQNIGFPLIGDKVYGFNIKANDMFDEKIKFFPRQALHAESLSLIHPKTNKNMNISSQLPDDLISLEKHLDDE